MLPLFRLPFVYFLLFFIIGIWPRRPYNYKKISSMHKLSFDDEFCTVYVCLVCLPLSMQRSILVVV